MAPAAGIDRSPFRMASLAGGRLRFGHWEPSKTYPAPHQAAVMMGGRHEEIDTGIVGAGDPRGRHSGGRVVDGGADAFGRVADIGSTGRDHGDHPDRRRRDGADSGDIADRIRHPQTPRQLTLGAQGRNA